MRIMTLLIVLESSAISIQNVISVYLNISASVLLLLLSLLKWPFEGCSVSRFRQQGKYLNGHRNSVVNCVDSMFVEILYFMILCFHVHCTKEVYLSLYITSMIAFCLSLLLLNVGCLLLICLSLMYYLFGRQKSEVHLSTPMCSIHQ